MTCGGSLHLPPGLLNFRGIDLPNLADAVRKIARSKHQEIIAGNRSDFLGIRHSLRGLNLQNNQFFLIQTAGIFPTGS